MLRKNQHGAQLLRNFPHEALHRKRWQVLNRPEDDEQGEWELTDENTYGIVAEPGDVALITGVEQNRSSRLLPVLVSYKVPLFEGAILQESKVINLEWMTTWNMK